MISVSNSIDSPREGINLGKLFFFAIWGNFFFYPPLKWGAVSSNEDGTNGNLGQNFETQVHAKSSKKLLFIFSKNDEIPNSAFSDHFPDGPKNLRKSFSARPAHENQ